MKRITENPLAGRAICAISNWGINHGHYRVCAAMAWIVNRFGEQPLIGDDWNDEERAEADLRAILSR
jgi:hypothetical protein